MQRLMTTLTAIRKPFDHLWSAIARYRSKHSNGEFEQSLNRISIGLLLFIYFDQIAPPVLAVNPVLGIDVRLVGSFYLISAALIGLSLILWPDGSPLRRVCAIQLDIGVLTVVLLIGGAHAAPLYFLYLWVIIGNGFRFGQIYLLITLGTTLFGFGIVIVLEPYWAAEWRMSVGLWIGTLLISMYFSLLVGRMFRALEQANAANLAKRQFICAVSHELRTPLNAIIGMVDLLRGTRVDAEQSDMLNCMTTTSQLMLSQIEDVLDFSKIEAGKMVIEHTDFDLYALVDSIISMFRYRIDADAVELIRYIDCRIPATLTGDLHHLRQILVNLVGNAVKFTEQGRIVLSIRRLASPDSSVRLLFTIKDTGIGIPEDVQDRIFESFTQADSSTARKYGGTGLGTTICKQLVELMGGQIGFTSKAGVGSEFWFDIEFFPSDDMDDISLLVAGQSLIIGTSDDESRLGFDIAALSKIRPMFARSVEHAVSEFGQRQLVRYSMTMVFIRESISDSETFDACIVRLRASIELLRRATNTPDLRAILIAGQEFPEGLADKIAEMAGFFSALPTIYEPEMLMNLLHAQSSLSSGEGATSVLPAEREFRRASVLSMPPTKHSEDAFRVLIVEDNPTNRKVLQKILEREGHQCTLACDGEEALDMIGTREFDAIVLDLNMPKLPGTEVAKFCKVMGGKAASTPIIMFSASVTQEAREESIRAGADAFMPKPIEVSSFIDTLNRLVRGNPRSGRHSSSSVTSLPKRADDRPEPVLEPEKLSNLESVSTDPYFLDELMVEFMVEGGRLLGVVCKGMQAGDLTGVTSALHALRGSALSIGATAFKVICTRIEKMPPNEMRVRRKDIQEELEQSFSRLCQELEIYRRVRMKKFGNPRFH